MYPFDIDFYWNKNVCLDWVKNSASASLEGLLLICQFVLNPEMILTVWKF